VPQKSEKRREREEELRTVEPRRLRSSSRETTGDVGVGRTCSGCLGVEVVCVLVLRFRDHDGAVRALLAATQRSKHPSVSVLVFLTNHLLLVLLGPFVPPACKQLPVFVVLVALFLLLLLFVIPFLLLAVLFCVIVLFITGASSSESGARVPASTSPNTMFPTLDYSSRGASQGVRRH